MRPPLGFVASLLALGCTTEIQIKNDLPNANIENARWVTAHDTYALEDESANLGPGEVSDSMQVGPDDEDQSGRIRFDVVTNGRRVALVTEQQFKAARHELSTFSIGADTPAKNLVASGD